MTPEDRFRALTDNDRWTVNVLQPRANPFGQTRRPRRRVTLREIAFELAAVAAMAAIVIGVTVAIHSRVPEPIAAPLPTATSPAKVTLISGTITDSEGEPFAADVPVQVMAISPDTGTRTLVEAGTTGEGGTFALTTTRFDSWTGFAAADGTIEFELQATSGREFATYPFSVQLEHDGDQLVILRLGDANNARVTSEYVAPPVVAPTASKIVLSTSSMSIQSDSGEVIDEFAFLDDDGDAAVTALTDIFGFEPDEVHYPDITHFRAHSELVWDGFTVHRYDAGVGDFDGQFAFVVIVETPEVNNIAIETVDGIAVGTPVQAARDAADLEDPYSAGGAEVDSMSLVYDTVLVDTDQVSDSGEPATYSVRANYANESTTVEQLRTPTANFGV